MPGKQLMQLSDRRWHAIKGLLENLWFNNPSKVCWTLACYLLPRACKGRGPPLKESDSTVAGRDIFRFFQSTGTLL